MRNSHIYEMKHAALTLSFLGMLFRYYTCLICIIFITMDRMEFLIWFRKSLKIVWTSLVFLAFEIDFHVHYSLLPYSLDASGFHLFPCALHLIFIQLRNSVNYLRHYVPDDECSILVFFSISQSALPNPFWLLLVFLPPPSQLISTLQKL